MEKSVASKSNLFIPACARNQDRRCTFSIKAWARDNPSVLNHISSTRSGGVRLQRARRGKARSTPAGMDLLEEYDSRTYKLLRLTSGLASVVTSGSGESGRV